MNKDITKFQEAPIWVTVAASVALNPESLKKSISGLMEKPGCGKCFSGFDCRLQLQQDFLIVPEFKKHAVNNPVKSESMINLMKDKDTTFSLEKISAVIGSLHKKFGCAPCHSGFDVQLQNEIKAVFVSFA